MGTAGATLLKEIRISQPALMLGGRGVFPPFFSSFLMCRLCDCLPVCKQRYSKRG